MVFEVRIIDRGGFVLWSATNDPSYTKPINCLLQDVLMKDRIGSDSITQDDYTLKWTLANDLKLVFVAVYFSFQKLLYVDALLKSVKQEFIKMFESSLKGGIANLTMKSYDFDAQYKKILKYYEKQSKIAKSGNKIGNNVNNNKFVKTTPEIRRNGTDIIKEGEKDSDPEGNDAAQMAAAVLGLFVFVFLFVIFFFCFLYKCNAFKSSYKPLFSLSSRMFFCCICVLFCFCFVCILLLFLLFFYVNPTFFSKQLQTNFFCVRFFLFLISLRVFFFLYLFVLFIMYVLYLQCIFGVNNK